MSGDFVLLSPIARATRVVMLHMQLVDFEGAKFRPESSLPSSSDRMVRHARRTGLGLNFLFWGMIQQQILGYFSSRKSLIELFTSGCLACPRCIKGYCSVGL